MTVRAASVLLALLLASGAAAQPAGGMRASGQNSVADALVQRGVEFGLDFDRNNPKAPHPTREASHQRFAAGFGAWLDAEVERGDDSISDPPPALRMYLRDRGDALWSLIAVLEKGSPDWGERPDDPLWRFQPLVSTVTLERVLLTVALSEASEGRQIDAERALEASWSLTRPLRSGDSLMDQLTDVAIEKLQAGVLRKIKEPPIPWMSRLSGDGPWTRMLEAVERESRPDTGLEEEAFRKALRRIFRAVGKDFRERSACDASKRADEDVWRDVAGEVDTDPSPAVRSSAETPASPSPTPGAESDDNPEPGASTSRSTCRASRTRSVGPRSCGSTAS